MENKGLDHQSGSRTEIESTEREMRLYRYKKRKNFNAAAKWLARRGEYLFQKNSNSTSSKMQVNLRREEQNNFGHMDQISRVL